MNALAFTLAELFRRAGLDDLTPSAAEVLATPLAGLAMDSRRLRPGEAFLAVAGRATDGRRYLADAAARGAAVLIVDGEVCEADRSAAGSVPLVGVEELPRKLGRLAAAWYDDPSRAVRLLGVTGTNGKTSCTHHLAELLDALGERAGICGTLGNGFPGALRDTGLTTADVVTLTADLAWMRDAGANWVAMEVSSHALDQDRTAGMRFAGALLTNLSRDHLDYHGSMDAYGEAKRQLFLAPGLEVAVLNRDDAFARSLPGRLPAAIELFDYSLTDSAASLHVRERTVDAHRSVVEIASVWGRGRLATSLLGDFLLSNLLGAVTLLAGLGLPLGALLAAAERVRPVIGRLQPFDHPAGFTCVVDYAHTPAALAQALGVLRAHFPGRVICVFGCGGERDAGKRSLMGAAAAAGADRIVLTDDNPRGEDGDLILAQIAEGVGAAVPSTVERDRAAAIALACAEAAPGDVVLVAGKGHENYQDGASGRVSYSDAAVVERLVRAAEREEARCCSG
ncbi:MAG: UDP-N-acetylmuramoyl-L-alanyl-D-glutamate--2,6-diaminopimelate ligase [Pseudomonadales bacterium]|jgi:UDP-N-acetylmuramoyl-L-alanyl-D-glutamate--2,6-diaminopimelate ligase|nr:UDP-N-acetylmuramoyl-L-alanyl-D-glutamate--2,6-diaminopimelate ligase [Pseudomonadales bacterium]